MAYLNFIFQHGSLAAYIFIFLILFAECGLFFGFFLPGDSLLLPVGLLAAQGRLSLLLVLLVASIASILGNTVGYYFGRQVGPALFSRPDSLFFKQENVGKAQDFYQKYGKKTIFLARFVPVVRTFAPIVAGVGEMEFHTFTLFNIGGGILWVALVTLVGYFLGNRIHNIDTYLLPIVGVIILLSFVPVLHHVYQSSKNRSR